MKKLIYLFLVAILFVSCGGSKKNVKSANSDEVEVTQLCQYMTDDENYYANSVAESTDMQMAKDKAINSARAEIASTIEAYLEQFVKRYRKDVNATLDEKTEDRLEILVKQILNSSTVVCDRMTRTNTGKYRAYISVKLNKSGVKEALKKGIMEDKELKLNYDQALFDKVADEAFDRKK